MHTEAALAAFTTLITDTDQSVRILGMKEYR
jgi:hypothetical protein